MKNIHIKVEKGYTPFNCLHLFSLKLASMGIVFICAWQTLNGQMSLAYFLMFVLFSFVIFGSVENINDAAHMLGLIDSAMNKLEALENGKRVKHTVTPVLGEKAAHNGKVIYSLDFEVTPHQLRHTYITNLIHSSVDPKTVQYLAGHESSKITMDIYAKVKYNRPDELVRTMGGAFAQWDAAQA